VSAEIQTKVQIFASKFSKAKTGVSISKVDRFFETDSSLRPKNVMEMITPLAKAQP
jgi:hypothetical protein